MTVSLRFGVVLCQHKRAFLTVRALIKINIAMPLTGIFMFHRRVMVVRRKRVSTNDKEKNVT